MTETPSSATSPLEPTLAPAPLIEGHVWLRGLGAGGFADVHLYRQANPPREVAIKILRAGDDARGREAMAREAAALASVSGHPAVVSLYAVGETSDGRPWLSMEYCPVADLSARVRRQPMDVSHALDLLVQVCAGVETLHRAGYVHRDIKPGNLMLTPWRRPVLADFGTALPVGEEVTDRTAGFSLLWAPPEQQDGLGIAHPSQDVWALAATAWTLLDGRSPFELPGGDNSAWALAARVRSGQVPPLARADVPPELESALRRALTVDPASRTPSAAALADELRGVQARLGLQQTPFHVLDHPLGVPAGTPSPTAGPRASAALGAALIDPESTRPLVVDRTVRRGVEVAPAPAPVAPPAPIEAPGRRGVRGWVVALIAVLAAVGAIAVTTALLFGQGATPAAVRPSTGVQPLDPVGAAPAPVANVAGVAKEGRVVWTWTASPEPGARYHVLVKRPGRPNVQQTTSAPSIDVEAVAGENCVEVVVTGKDGRPSDAARQCVTVP